MVLARIPKQQKRTNPTVLVQVFVTVIFINISLKKANHTSGARVIMKIKVLHRRIWIQEGEESVAGNLCNLLRVILILKVFLPSFSNVVDSVFFLKL